MPELKQRLEEINKAFEKLEVQLKEQKEKAIDIAWKDAIFSGKLKQDLS